jgi:phosphate starvation-inducible PhoH-like protein
MKSINFTLEPNDSQRIITLCGSLNENIHLIERYLAVEIIQRGNNFRILGPKTAVENASKFLQDLYLSTKDDNHLSNQDLNLSLQALSSTLNENKSSFEHMFIVKTKSKEIKPRTINQERYIKRIQENDINFGIGPAGTGKTYLAVACAVAALESNSVKRIILVRPAVEAGEHLGFLPGDLAQKIDPYLRPIYDALYDLMGIVTVEKLIENKTIEIAPLAYMRGRTLNNAFIILDESQNTTKEQMKMFLTRIGFNSSAVITGDITQVDLPKHIIPGLRHAVEVLSHVDGIRMTFFETVDVVRHPLVQQIVFAYENFEAKK